VQRDTIDVTTAADLIVRELLGVAGGEQVALVCDPLSEEPMVRALAASIEAVGAEYTVFVMPARAEDRKNELTRPIEKGLEGSDCLIGLTRSCGAPTYSRAVRRLLDAKSLRSISMVMRDMVNFTSGGATADYAELHEEGEALAAIWRQAERIRVTTPAGTELEAPIAGEIVFVECGYATQPGQEAAFSDGEVSQMPRVATAEGTVVVDGPIAHIGLPASPIELTVSGGRVTAVSGTCPQAKELQRIIETIPYADNVAEIGIGLNPMCRRNGDFEEEKKARGLVHVAIGDNVFYGGDVECAVHMDMVLYSPTVSLDQRRVVDNGEVVFGGGRTEAPRTGS
jgi:leucyl aminopeptidase (aminopeptidase T)